MAEYSIIQKVKFIVIYFIKYYIYLSNIQIDYFKMAYLLLVKLVTIYKIYTFSKSLKMF